MPTSTPVVCAACGREDFAGGRRCQFCTELLPEESASDVGDIGFALDDLEEIAAPAAAAEAPPDEGAPPDADVPPPRDAKSKRSGVAGWLMGLGLLLLKGKSLILLAVTKGKFLFVLLKSGKFLTTGLSMLASMAVYAVGFGWVFAAGLVGLLFVHEMGHVWAMKRRGMPVSAPLFIPFMGAFIALKKMPQDAETEAAISIGGPALGTLGALACLGAYALTGWEMLLPIAYFGFFLNLFNLVPVPPLDGGRIVAAISPRIWWIGIPILILLGLRTGSFIIWLVLLFGIPRVLAAKTNTDYFQVSDRARRAFGFGYLGLLIATGTLMLYSHGVGAQAGLFAKADFGVNGQASAPAKGEPKLKAGDPEPAAGLSPMAKTPEQKAADAAASARRIREMPLGRKGLLLLTFSAATFLAWLASAALASVGGGRPVGRADFRLAAAAMLVGAVLLAIGLTGHRILPRAVSAYLVVGVGVFLSAAVGAISRLYSGRPGRREAVLGRGVVMGFIGLLLIGLAAADLRALLLYPLLGVLVAVLRNPSILLGIYVEARYGNRPAEAARLLERALRWPLLSRRGRMALRQDLASACMRRGDYEGASENARLAVADADAWPSLEVMPRGELADADIELGRYDEAVEECARVFALVERGVCFGGTAQWTTHAHALLAHLNTRRGVSDEALLHAEKALESLDPRQALAGDLRTSAAVAHWCRAEALREQGDLAAADEACAAGMRLSPRALWFSRLLSARAGIRCAQERWEDAEADGRQALSLFPDNPDAHYWVASASGAQGRAEEADRHLEAGARAYPGHAYALRCRELAALDMPVDAHT